MTVLYFYWTRTPLLNKVESLPPLISHRARYISQVVSFRWPGRRYCQCGCCCCTYKRTSNTPKSVLSSFRFLRAFSLRSGLWPWTEKSSSLRRLHFIEIKISIRLLFQARSNIGAKYQNCHTQEADMKFIPFSFSAHVTCQEKVFTRRIYSSRKSPMKSHTSASSFFVSVKFVFDSLCPIIDGNLSAQCRSSLYPVLKYFLSASKLLTTDRLMEV